MAFQYLKRRRCGCSRRGAPALRTRSPAQWWGASARLLSSPVSLLSTETASGKDLLHAAHRQLFSLYMCFDIKARAGKDLEVSEGHCTNSGYVIIPELNKVSLPLQGGGGKEGRSSRDSPLPHTSNMAKTSLISHASGLRRNLFAPLLSITLTFTSQTIFLPFFSFSFIFSLNLKYLTLLPFESRPGNPDLIKM